MPRVRTREAPPTAMLLAKMYLDDRRHPRDIAVEYGCSERKIWYWIEKYNIRRQIPSVSRDERLVLREALRRYRFTASPTNRTIIDGLLLRLKGR